MSSPNPPVPTPSAATLPAPASIPPGTPPPGPRDRALGLTLLRAMQRDYLGFAERLHRTHGDVVAMRLVHERSWDLFHPDDVRTALVDHADHLVRWERGVAVFAQSFGRGLLVAEGADWRRQRRMLAPGFLPGRVHGYAALMVEAARDALEAALPGDDDPALGVRVMDEVFDRVAIEVVLRTLFGSRAPVPARAVSEATRRLSEDALREMFRPVSLPAWLPLPHLRARRRALRVLTDLVDARIAERRARPADEPPGQDLLAMLLSARDEDGSPLSDTELRDQCLVMFQAGHETTATALLWWSWLMARHPDAARRAAAEVDAVLQGRDPTAADLASLPFLGATLREALRLYPPVAALMTRRVVRPFVLAGRTVPAGTALRITPWVIHRDARWFPRPGSFEPDRFLGGAAPAPRGAWMPFGTGPRVCIGQHFALLEMTVVAAVLLQRCTLQPVPGEPDPQPRLHVTLRPQAPLRLRLGRRSPTASPGTD